MDIILLSIVLLRILLGWCIVDIMVLRILLGWCTVDIIPLAVSQEDDA